MKGRPTIPIICIEKDGTFVVFSGGIADAARALHCNVGNIWGVLNGRHDQAIGRRFVYADKVYIKNDWLYYKDTNQPVPLPRERYKIGRRRNGQTEPVFQSDWEAERATRPKPWRPDRD